MERDTPDFLEEEAYLKQTQKVIIQSLQGEESTVEDQADGLLEAKKEWWENSRIGKYLDANQYMDSIQMKATAQYATQQRISRYRDSLNSPYFARVDFKESGYPEEKIYIGLNSVTDEDTYETYVYDWRAPVSSIFYRYELGPASYEAPSGTISGEITRKRQYEIKDGELRFFFDSSIEIQDEILRGVLSHNASPTMKSIVETIQRQQDEIIRDTTHDLLMVQGVAGSGKTAVALHRIAYLMYQELNQSLSAQNILILSPNNVFSRYIANVLPELGQESIRSVTFEEIFRKNVYWNGAIESKNDYIEKLTSSIPEKEKELRRQSAAFFASPEFCGILQHYHAYVKEHIPFEDVYYNNRLLMTRKEMSNLLQRNERTMSTEKALQLVSTRLWDAIHEERKKRLEYLVEFYRPTNEHRYDYRTYARYTSIREITKLKHKILEFTTLDYGRMFIELLNDKKLLKQMAGSISLPDNWEILVDNAAASIKKNELPYGVSLAMFYWKNRFTGSIFPDIRQVVIDEAQDYYPLHFYLLGSLFPEARFTVLGDINQTIEKEASLDFYDTVAEALEKKSSALITMNKGFRCSWEISKFSERFLETPFPVEAFDRHGPQPQIHQASSMKDEAHQIASAVHSCKQQNYESVAIICKTMERAKALYEQIKSFVDCKVVTDHSSNVSGVSIVPLYLAKGLEFDAVLLDEVTAENYHTPFDKKLLYICATRPLHRLDVFYSGKASMFLKEKE